MERLFHASTWCLLLALGASLAWAQDTPPGNPPPRSLVVEGAAGGGTALFAPLADEASAGNAGLFVGVNQFTVDPDVQPLRFAVNDAVEQCHLFVTELKLLSARQCYLALSGEPAGERVTRHLAELKQLGVQVVGAEKSTILRSFVRARQGVQTKTGLLVVSFSSHGFTDKRIGYVMPSDGLRTFLEDTAIRLSSVEEQMNASQAGHRLLLVDACQERLSDGSRSSEIMNGQAMTADFLELLKKPTGQSKLVSCDVGEFSYEHAELGGAGHGVFTHAVLEALRGGAAADDQNVVRLSAVAGYVERAVRAWTEDQNRRRRPGDPEKKQSPSYLGPEAARELPLAKKAGDLAALVASVRRQPTTGTFTTELRSQLAEMLSKLDPRQDADQELLAATRDFVNGKARLALFVPYVSAELDRRGKLPPRMVRATFVVRDGSEEDSPWASGVRVELQWQETGSSQWKLLGATSTNDEGQASLEFAGAALPTSSGRYYARVSQGTREKNWSLDSFPATSSWRLYLPRPTMTLQPGSTMVNSLGMKLAYIPPGEFDMGSPEEEEGRSSDETRHQVRLTKGFYLGQYEVTQEEYVRVMGRNPSDFKTGNPGPGQRVAGQDTKRFPVENVDWEDAVEFCKRLSELPDEAKAGHVYRLPTEAEWEYACRAGSKTAYSFGESSTSLGDFAWFDDNSKYRTHRVGLKKPNAWGLYDMYGNVKEWCLDPYDDYPKNSLTNPMGSTSSLDRVTRGGGWLDFETSCRSAMRSRCAQTHRQYDGDQGFRVVLSLRGISGAAEQDQPR